MHFQSGQNYLQRLKKKRKEIISFFLIRNNILFIVALRNSEIFPWWYSNIDL